LFRNSTRKKNAQKAKNFSIKNANVEKLPCGDPIRSLELYYVGQAFYDENSDVIASGSPQKNPK
jgi:hypothetical protein